MAAPASVTAAAPAPTGDSKAASVSTSATAAAAAAAAKPAAGTFSEKAKVKHDLFASTSAGSNYAAYRPTYPKSLFDEIVEYTRAGPPKHAGTGDTATSASAAAAPKNPLALCVDVGSGTGQATAELAGYFSSVLGVEGSKAMRDGATKKPNITYLPGVAEQLPSECVGADLITVAQALHWFDLPKFWAECLRVLRPGGSVAVWTYALAEVDGNAAASQLMSDYHFKSIGPFWDEKRVLVDNHYRDILLPEAKSTAVSGFVNVQRLTRSMGRDMTIRNLMHFAGTSSALKTMREKAPELPDPRIELEAKLLKLYGATDPDAVTVKVTHVVTLLLGQKPW